MRRNERLASGGPRPRRDTKRQEVLAQRREAAAPRIVALLPLSGAVDARAAWNLFLDACGAQSHGSQIDSPGDSEADMDISGVLSAWKILGQHGDLAAMQSCFLCQSYFTLLATALLQGFSCTHGTNLVPE